MLRRIVNAAALVLLVGFPPGAYSQTLMLGGKVAGQITDTFTKEFHPSVIADDRFVFGPMAEVRLPRRLSLEVDALHKRKLNYTAGLFPLAFENKCGGRPVIRYRRRKFPSRVCAALQRNAHIFNCRPHRRDQILRMVRWRRLRTDGCYRRRSLNYLI